MSAESKASIPETLNKHRPPNPEILESMEEKQRIWWNKCTHLVMGDWGKGGLRLQKVFCGARN